MQGYPQGHQGKVPPRIPQGDPKETPDKGDPGVERKEWRLWKAADAIGDRIPPGKVGIRGATRGARDANDGGLLTLWFP